MRKFTQEQEEEVGQRYEAGENLPQLAKAYGVDRMTIWRAIKRTGRLLRSKKIALKQYSLNERAFTELTPGAAYWIGFLMADGCIKDRWRINQSWVLSVDLKRSDRQHLIKFASFLSYDGSISDNKTRCTSVMSVISDNLINDLKKWGLSVRKSLNEKPNDALLNNCDYWRGEVDGDGSIWMGIGNYPGEYMPAISLVGGEYLITKFAKFIKSFTDTKAKPLHSGNRLWRFQVRCKAAVDIICKLYGNCDVNLALDRKLELANQIMNCWPNGYDGATKSNFKGA